MENYRKLSSNTLLIYSTELCPLYVHRHQNKNQKRLYKPNTRIRLYCKMKIQIWVPWKFAVIILKFEWCGSINRMICPKDADGMPNTVDPDQNAPTWRNSLILGTNGWACLRPVSRLEGAKLLRKLQTKGHISDPFYWLSLLIWRISNRLMLSSLSLSDG